MVHVALRFGSVFFAGLCAVVSVLAGGVVGCGVGILHITESVGQASSSGLDAGTHFAAWLAMSLCWLVVRGHCG